MIAAGVRDGATWPGPVAVAFLIGAGSVSIMAAILGRRRGLDPALASAVVRIGAVLVVATGTIVALLVLRDLGALWVAADVAIGGGVGALVVIVWRRLRRVSARPAVIRAWTVAGTTLLVLAALFVGLE